MNHEIYSSFFNATKFAIHYINVLINELLLDNRGSERKYKDS